MLAVQWAPVAILALHLYLEDARHPVAGALRRGVAAAGACRTATRCSFSRCSSACGCCGSSCCSGSGGRRCRSRWRWRLPASRWRRSCRSTWRCTRGTGSRAAPPRSGPSAPTRWAFCARRSRSAPGAGCDQACVPEGAAVPGPRHRVAVRGRIPAARVRRHADGWSDRRWLVALRVLAIAFAAVQLASAVAVAVGGPWNVEWGPISAHAASAARPFMFAAVALAFAFVIVAGLSRRAARGLAARLLPGRHGGDVVGGVGARPQGGRRGVGGARPVPAA